MDFMHVILLLMQGTDCSTLVFCTMSAPPARYPVFNGVTTLETIQFQNFSGNYDRVD